MAADDLARQMDDTALQAVARTAARVLDAVTPDGLQGGPRPGAWREEHGAEADDDCLFAKILVPVMGNADDWPAVVQAAQMACRERAQLLGLHVVPTAQDQASPRVQEVRAAFVEQCQVVGHCRRPGRGGRAEGQGHLRPRPLGGPGRGRAGPSSPGWGGARRPGSQPSCAA